MGMLQKKTSDHSDRDSVNRMIPPLILAKEHVDQAIEIMRDAINEAAAKYEADQKTA